MIRIELFDPQKHYETVCQWWAAQGWPVVPLSHLPQTGVVVSLDGELAAAAWLYKTDSAICWLEFIVASPDVRGRKRGLVLSALISSTRTLAQVLGFQTVFMSTRNQSLGSRLEAQGFVASDREMTNYTCELSRRG